MKKRQYQYQADIKDWLKRAQEDFTWAEYNFKGHYWTQTCFVCQQVAEKALKALLLAKIGNIPRIHKLPQLAKSLEKIFT